MVLPSSGGLMAAIMSGGPLPLPAISCALCLAISNDDIASGRERDTDTPENVFVSPGVTIAGGWLVCAFHAEVLAHQLTETNYNRNGGPDPIRNDGTRRLLGDCFTLPPPVMS